MTRLSYSMPSYQKAWPYPLTIKKLTDPPANFYYIVIGTEIEPHHPPPAYDLDGSLSAVQPDLGDFLLSQIEPAWIQEGPNHHDWYNSPFGTPETASYYWAEQLYLGAFGRAGFSLIDKNYRHLLFPWEWGPGDDANHGRPVNSLETWRDFGSGSWELRERSDGVQVVIHSPGVADCLSVYVSLSGSFTGGGYTIRPTAPDELGLGYLGIPKVNHSVGGIFSSDGQHSRMVFERGANLYDIIFIETVETALPENVWPINKVVITSKCNQYGLLNGSGITYAQLSRPTSYPGVFATLNSSAPSIICELTTVGSFLTDGNGTPTNTTGKGYCALTREADINSERRFGQVWVSLAGKSTAAQSILGYIPDLYFAPNGEHHNLFPDSGDGVWGQVGDLILPNPVTEANAWDEINDSGLYSRLNGYMLDGSDAFVDLEPPTFAGIVSATSAGYSDVTVTWSAGTDNRTDRENLVYQIHASGAAEDEFTIVATSPPGATEFTVGGLTSGTTYYFRVRCVDEAGNYDSNTVELSASPEAVHDEVPVITIESPPETSFIRPFDEIVFTVTDQMLLRRVMIYVSYPNARYIKSTWLYDGFQFHPDFAGSSKTTITNGYRFRVRCANGWPSSPRITLDPINTVGNAT